MKKATGATRNSADVPLLVDSHGKEFHTSAEYFAGIVLGIILFYTHTTAVLDVVYIYIHYISRRRGNARHCEESSG